MNEYGKGKKNEYGKGKMGVNETTRYRKLEKSKAKLVPREDLIPENLPAEEKHKLKANGTERKAEIAFKRERQRVKQRFSDTNFHL